MVGCVLSRDPATADFTIISTANFETLQALRYDTTNKICFVIFEDAVEEKHRPAIEALGIWAWGVLPKTTSATLSMLLSWTHLAQKIKKVLEENNHLKGLVDRDPLTGLLNMNSFYERLEAEMARASRYRRSLCVAMIDIDNFKLINDFNDHVFGSAVLQELGRLIRESTRHVDHCARFGGDEFVIALVETDISGALQFCERLRQEIAIHTFREGARETKLTASFGISQISLAQEIARAEILAESEPRSQKLEDSSGPSEAAFEFVRRADLALYKAKNSGKNCVRVYLPDPVHSIKLPEHDS